MPSLNAEQVRAYHEKGYYFPVQALSEKQTTEFRARFLDYLGYHRSRLAGLAPRDHYIVLSETHTYLKWVYQIVSHPSVLDAVESILGPNLLVWGSRWFSKMPGDKAYVSWHQDATYWGLHPPNVTTAWIALSESVPGNGCMRVIPETHKGGLLPQRETYYWRAEGRNSPASSTRHLWDSCDPAMFRLRILRFTLSRICWQFAVFSLVESVLSHNFPPGLGTNV
jgi:non-haem Fe2+, alpha-ketoglutarate-dependent halogenase